MPPKRTQAKKTASEETKKRKSVRKTVASKKKSLPQKAISQKEKPSGKKLAKTVTIDVISDDYESPEISKSKVELPPVDIAKIDSQKKYFSDLVSEIKSKQAKIKDEDKPGNQKQSLRIYRRLAFRFLFLIGFFLLVLGYFAYSKLVVVIIPAAEAITDSVTFEVIPFSQIETDLVSAQLVPGEINQTLISVEKVYPSSGEENIGEEVIGRVTIYNEYSRSQPLVATTRLLSPDKKLFRIREGVNVPAGGSVEVEVYADQASLDMAIEPTSFTIPGLWAGLQDRIYAVSQEDFEYRGRIRNYVRQSDLDLAANDIRRSLAEKLRQEIAWQTLSGEAVAYQIDEGKSLITINAELGDNREDFIARAENEAIIARFSKERAEELLRAKLAFRLPEEKTLIGFNSEQITYVINDFFQDEGRASVTAIFSGSSRLKSDTDFIDHKKLSGLSQAQIEEYLKSFPEVADFELKFSPSFLSRAPYLADRIKIEIKE